MFGDDLAATVGGWLDHVFTGFAFRNRPLGEDEREMLLQRFVQAAARYGTAEARAALFAEPGAADLRGSRVGRLSGGAVVDVGWRSTYRAVDAGYARMCARYPANMDVRARWYRHDVGPGRQAPACALVVHGWGMGVFPVDQVVFRAGWLYRRGLDVMLVQLPFHGMRAPGDRAFPPMFPSFRDPARTIEGFAQTVADLRVATRALLDVHGAAAVGAFGMSLGGFATALLATAEARLGFAVSGIPFASFADLVWDGTAGDGGGAGQAAARLGVEAEVFRAAFAAVEPLARPAAMDPRGIVVVAAEHDQVTPTSHAERLHAHFAGSRLVTFPGGHLLQWGRDPMFEAVVDAARLATASAGVRRADE